ncbi:hypothetical protein OG738_29015 [Amycolatopsis sp. NBC_01488]|uniref:hypothetical protein n=1 Tax=Amycolatopsis sp. NBC_01488 TaxID=2903563 RepID=UPI002E2A2890|nr:hypothetical protein [Amycolatopsis sp. NBC_01488]
MTLPAQLELADDEAMVEFVKSMPSMAAMSDADVARVISLIRNLDARRVRADPAAGERLQSRGPRSLAAKSAVPAAGVPGRARPWWRRPSAQR